MKKALIFIGCVTLYFIIATEINPYTNSKEWNQALWFYAGVATMATYCFITKLKEGGR